MSSREQYKELHKRQRAAIRDLNLAVEKLNHEIKETKEVVSVLGTRLFLLRHTKWWKIWKLIKIIRKLRQS